MLHILMYAEVSITSSPLHFDLLKLESKIILEECIVKQKGKRVMKLIKLEGKNS